jgi:DNA (cytosine-5)-methyltransferase 1
MLTNTIEKEHNKRKQSITKNVQEPKFTFIDLFAGIGGFHLALHSLGGQCVFASELDKHARITYERNFRKYSPLMFEKGLFNNNITDPSLNYETIPNFDILCAGFPCQPFSHAGLKKGFSDTRGTLFFNIEEIVRTKIECSLKYNATSIPKVLFLENVKGLVNHNRGNTYKTIVNHLKLLGYEVSSQVLNSKNFGVPQNRERIFIVAWHKDTINIHDFHFPVGLDTHGNSIFEKGELENKVKKVTVGDILLDEEQIREMEAIEGVSYTISEKLWNGHQRRRMEHKRKGNGFGYSLFNRESQYTSTISARYYKDGSEILIQQSKELNPRKLHPIEAAKLQGYPVGENVQEEHRFVIPVSNVQAYKQFGNSVSVPVIKQIGKEILRQLMNANQD